jgi:phage RecT family recombinase
MAAQMKPDPNEPGTSVATVEPARPYALKSPIAQLLQSDAAMAVIAPLVPHGLDYRQIVSEVYRAGVNDPKILKCTPPSIIDAVATVVQTGLTVGKTIYLVPQRTKVSAKGEPERYEDRLQAWTSYVGDIELVVRSGAARHVDGQAVYAADRFDVSLGSAPDVVHVPERDAAKRGALVGAYAIAYLNGTGTLRKVVWMPLVDVEKIRAKSKSSGPKYVPVCPDWYAIKSAIHRVCKTLPKNEKLARVIALFDRQDAEDRGDEAFSELPAGLDPTKQIAADRQPQLMASVDPTDPYKADVSGHVQPADVKAEIVHDAPRTAAQRAAIEAAANAADPYAEATAPLDDEDDLPFSETAQAREPLSSEAYQIPAGLGPKSGTTLGALSTPDLEQLYRWASKPNALKNYPDLAHHCEELLESRRNGEATEPRPA